jgi:hypothetical protein
LTTLTDRSVILVRGGDTTGWRSLGYADADYEQVVRQIIARAPDWRASDHADRLDYFAGLLGHENRTIADLAYLEVGGAPYSKIKSLSDRVRPEQIRAFLGDIAYYDWRALYILMLAQSDDREDRDDILKPLRRIANGGIKLDYPSLFAVGYYLGMAADSHGEQAR